MNINQRNLLEDLFRAGGSSKYSYVRHTKEPCNSDLLKEEGFLNFTDTKIWLTEKGIAAAKKLIGVK